MINKSFVNYTWNKQRRIDLKCGVSYSDDLDKAENVAIKAVKALDSVKKIGPFRSYTTNSGRVRLPFIFAFGSILEKNLDFLKPQSDAIKAIKKKFDENDITIPFPIRTLDFGVKGGEKLFDQDVKVKT